MKSQAAVLIELQNRRLFEKKKVKPFARKEARFYAPEGVRFLSRENINNCVYGNVRGRARHGGDSIRPQD